MNLAEKLKAVLDHLRSLPPTKAREKAIERLEECALWAACALQDVGHPIDLANEPSVDFPPSSGPRDRSVG